MPPHAHYLRWCLFTLLLTVYALLYTGRPDSLDGEAMLAVSTSLVHSGTPTMNALAYSDWLAVPMPGMGMLGVDGAVYAKKGMLPSVALVPVVALAELIPCLSIRAAALLLNPLLTAWCAAVVFTAVWRLRYPLWIAFATSLLYGVGTMALVYARTLYDQPLAVLLFVLIALWWIGYRETGSRWQAVGIGLALGLALLVNTIYALAAPLVLLLLRSPKGSPWRQHGHNLLWMLLAVGSGVLLLAIYNTLRFGQPWVSGYGFSSGEGFIHPLLTGLYGLFLSPYRGLFWYTPLLVLVIPALVIGWRRDRSLTLLLFTMGGFHAVAFASWWSWHGGVTWGPRFLLPLIPLWILLLLPLFALRWGRVALAGLAMLSLTVQILGSIYDYLPYVQTLNTQIGTSDFTSIVAGLEDRVLTDVSLSAIVGHAEALLGGRPLDVSFSLGKGLALVGLLGLSLLAVGMNTGRFRQIKRGMGGIYPVGIGVACILLAFGSSDPRMNEMQQAIDPQSAVVVADSGWSNLWLDLEGRRSLTVLHAPTSADDARAQSLWNYTLRQSDRITLVTWFAPGQTENWAEQQLWAEAAFIREQTVAERRVLTFDQRVVTANQSVGVRFGEVMLTQMGAAQMADGVGVTVVWDGVLPPAPARWFIHVLDAEGNLLAQQDRVPGGGYPGLTTDRLFLAGVTGAAALRIGWVDAAGERLAVIDANGESLPEGFVVLPLG
jgi:hypothetical protein